MIVIGELINATRKKVGEAVVNHDENVIKDRAVAQAEAGADYIDVNVGTGKGDTQQEIEDMKWAVNAVQEVIDKPISVDSPDNEVIRAGLEVCAQGQKHFVNSVTAESDRLIPTLELVKEYETNVVALAMGDEGIKVEPEERLEAASRIMDKVREMGIPDDTVYFDPLVMPLGTDPRNPCLTLKTGCLILEKYPDVKLAMGLSNVSHGLPERKLLNRIFLTLAMHSGFQAVLIDPTDTQMMETLYAADALLGNDEFCMNFIQFCRSRQE
jgi:5-methyltetrahydrofolate--homocysteine methyltransferase